MVSGIVRDGLGLKYHWGVADYLQRAARHIASKTDVEQAYAVGKPRWSLPWPAGTRSCPPSCESHRTPTDGPWAKRICPKSPTWRRRCPATSYPRMGSASRRACREYLTPLIQGEDYPPYKDGLPDYVTLKNEPVEKKLPEFKI